MYLWLSLFAKENGRIASQLGPLPALWGERIAGAENLVTTEVGLARNTHVWELDWLKAVCRAGALVLAVGFWFDGGLFKLPTAATFLILLELGRV